MSILMLVLAIAGAETPPDPIAPAKVGMCHAPDDAKKTCRSLASYEPVGHGSYINEATIRIAPDPLVTLRTSTPVYVANGAICGTLTDAQIATAKLFLSGKEVPDGRAGAIRVEIGGAMAAFIGKEICTSYSPGENGQLIANAAVSGVAHPELQQTVRWVSPADGYKVAP